MKIKQNIKMKSTVVNNFMFAVTACLPAIGISMMAEPAQAQACTPLPAGDLVALERYYHNDFWAHNRDHYYRAAAAPALPAPAPGSAINVRGAQYTFESIEGQVYTTQVPGTIPLYEMYDVGLRRDHFYTSSQQDINSARVFLYQPAGQQPEVVGYIFPPGSNYCDTTELFRLYNLIAHDHFYTTDLAERDNATRQGYALEASPGFVLEDAAGVAARKNPVVIVAGTLAIEPIYWPLRDRLTRDGYATEIFQLPHLGLRDIQISATALEARVNQVLANYQADQVNLIGHSQGSLVARTYIHNIEQANPGNGIVEHMINLAGPNQGTEVVKEPLARALGCPATITPNAALTPNTSPCNQMAVGSTLVDVVNANAPDTVSYTNFTTNNDIFVTPVQNGQMNCVPLTNCENIHVQAQCPNQIFLEHLGLAFNGPVYSGIRQAFADEPIQLDCNAL
ncbi:MAG: hypothetical protein ACPGVO_10355 [Spirulinaceae cyanobacterium]